MFIFKNKIFFQTNIDLYLFVLKIKINKYNWPAAESAFTAEFTKAKINFSNKFQNSLGLKPK